MRKNICTVSVILMALLWACLPGKQFKVDQSYHGFKLKEKRFVEEVNAECLYFIHEKSGARLLKIAADDANKLFNIAFKTVPEHDYGTPHIMEHSVLNGSRNFPVKSPFDVLSKGSLNTFLNAMTGSEITTYPVASMNQKDYFNLMHVYLDAVFNPMIYDDPRILEQEGWHHELESEDGKVVYKGVVYNEMKGAYSSPTRELDYQVSKVLFPDNTYGVSSGGYPTEIPKLTQEYFINFHKKFYHPSNSYILLYGDADLNNELQFIDAEYLSNYEKSEDKVEIPLQKPFEAMKSLEKPYAVPEGSDTKDKTYLSLSFVAGKSTDRTLSMAFDVLSEALVNHESAPVRLALQEAGIGKEVRASFAEMKQNVFEIQVQNANPEDGEAFKEIVFNTLEKVAKEGLDKTMLEGILNRMEFNLKEGDTPQKGLRYLFMNYQGWFFEEDPFLGLEFNKPLQEVKQALETNMLEELVSNHLMNNPHALLMVLKPQPGLQAEINEATNKELADYQNTLSQEDKKKLVQHTKDLIAYQKEEDTPEALATIPMLTLADITPEVEWYNVQEKSVADLPVLHLDEFTNNILYTKLYFDLKTLPQEQVLYAKLLSVLLGKLSTENYTFGELDNVLNIHTGGFSTDINTYLKDYSDDDLQAKFIVTAKATTDKANKLSELTSEILNLSKFDDAERLKSLLTRHQSRVEAFMRNNGLNVAMLRLNSYFTNSGAFDEQTNGLSYYRFVTDLVTDFDDRQVELSEQLSNTAQLLFNKSNMLAAVTCSEDNFNQYAMALQTLVNDLSDDEGETQNWAFVQEKKNEGLQSASKVQYVIQGYDFKKLGYEWDGKMRVLNQVLSRDWLQTQIRVIGGAYGGFSGFSPSGQVYFASYRDPNLKETLENYKATPEYLQSFEADSTTMTRYIIGTIARMDRPRTPSQKGSTAFARYLSNESIEDLQAERAAILATTREDIQGFEQLVRDVLNQEVICVYGNDQKVLDNKDVFGEVIKVTN
jgi:Zn-dependent M16 (insulinase) family peptidase